MYEVNVFSTTPGGVRTNISRDYYEVADALTVAEIERKNALLPIGRTEEYVPDRLSYEIVSRYNERVVITIRNDRGEAITLRDPQR